MRKLTPESVKQLCATLTQHYDVELIEHWRDGAETQMAVLTLYLQHLGVRNVPDFLKWFTASMFDEIYLPCEPGSGTLPLNVQAMMFAGALQRVLHARQCDRPNEGHLLYLFAPVNRVYAELDAIRARMEVHWWYSMSELGQPLLPLWGEEDYGYIDEWLPMYGCSSISVELARAKDAFVKMMYSVQRGEVKCDAAKDVIEFFGWGTAEMKS